MKLIKDKTNAIPIGGDYPYGDIKDDDGTFNGTPLDRELYGDYIQFFERMFAQSGLAANGLPDNSLNDFQLFEALEDISNEIKLRGARGYTTGAAMLVDMSIVAAGLVEFDLLFKVLDFALGTGLGSNIVSMGVANIGAEVFVYMNPVATSIPRFVINSTSLGSGAVIKKNGVVAVDTVFIPTASTTLHFVKMSAHWDLSVRP